MTSKAFAGPAPGADAAEMNIKELPITPKELKIVAQIAIKRIQPLGFTAIGASERIDVSESCSLALLVNEDTDALAT